MLAHTLACLRARDPPRPAQRPAPSATAASAAQCGIAPRRSDDPAECLALVRRDGAAILTGGGRGEDAAGELPWTVFGDDCVASLRPTEIRFAPVAGGAVAVTRLEPAGPRQGAGAGTEMEAEGDFQELNFHSALDPLHQDGIKAFGAACPDYIFLACDQACGAWTPHPPCLHACLTS